MASTRIEVTPRCASAFASGTNSVRFVVLTSPSQCTNRTPGCGEVPADNTISAWIRPPDGDEYVTSSKVVDFSCHDFAMCTPSGRLESYENVDAGNIARACDA